MKLFKTYTIAPPEYFIQTNGYYWRYSIKDYSTSRDDKFHYRWQACRAAWRHFKGREKYRIKYERENSNWVNETDSSAVFKLLIKKHQ